MKRALTLALVLVLALSLTPLTACSRKVEVKSGKRVVCTYGEIVSDSVRTLQVPAADAGKYTVTTETVTCDRHKRAEALYAAAQKALGQANEAVEQRDYRLALNHALESREQAQNAARTAADTRARLRGDTERALAEVTSLIVQTRNRLSALPPARARRVRQSLITFTDDVQKAGKAIQAEDYEGAQRILAGVKDGIQTLQPPPAAPPATQSPKRSK